MRPIAHAFTTKVTVPPHWNAVAMGFLRSGWSGRFEVSSYVPAWAHRELHRLQFTHWACRTGLSARDRNKSGSQVVRQAPRRVNSCRHGALGGCFVMVNAKAVSLLGTVWKLPAPCQRIRWLTDYPGDQHRAPSQSISLGEGR